MKAILINDDKSLSWSEVENPVIKSDEVLVKIGAAALNRADLMQREGDYPPPPGCPEWMGLEISGTVEKMGATAAEKSGFKLGDRVSMSAQDGKLVFTPLPREKEPSSAQPVYQNND